MAGDWAAAAAAYSAALAAGPSSRLLLNRSCALGKLSRWQEALGDAALVGVSGRCTQPACSHRAEPGRLQVLAAEPQSARALLRAGQALLQLGCHQQAEAVLLHSLGLHPGQKQLQALLAEAQQLRREGNLTCRQAGGAGICSASPPGKAGLELRAAWRQQQQQTAVLTREQLLHAVCPQTPLSLWGASQQDAAGGEPSPAAELGVLWDTLGVPADSSQRQIRCAATARH